MKLIIAKNEKDLLNCIGDKNTKDKILYSDRSNNFNNLENIKVNEENVIITQIASDGKYYNNIIDRIWFRIIKRK